MEQQYTTEEYLAVVSDMRRAAEILIEAAKIGVFPYDVIEALQVVFQKLFDISEKLIGEK